MHNGQDDPRPRRAPTRRCDPPVSKGVTCERRPDQLMDIPASLARSQDLANKVAVVYQKRAQVALDAFADELRKAWSAPSVAQLAASPAAPAALWSDWHAYLVDATQRSILFWDTLRERGNAFIEHTRAGLPPVLHFDYETIVDGRALRKPVNYALVRIVPPEGVEVDPEKRPYVIIDPRAGHGPGIGGFKDDSQVGVALRAGHPVYFVIFFRDPEPGQTLLDVCEAEKAFVREVRARHPRSDKPAIVGNCQGGWAAMMLAASDAEDTGPIVINGAPMSYWGGAWQEGEGDNPMRYAGGLLGGTWLASLTSDLGDGVFDGAHLVQNFENLNPANTFWDKYYHLYSRVDTEAPRFLEFERWWGGFYLMNREEIEWITRNLFVGNKLWRGETRSGAGQSFDLRDIRSPIVLFASLGDNITPPQQAFNWVADVYGSTEEIKARGQVIVGLMHRDVGHLGIFVSGRVATKEHAQIVTVLESIEALPPGLWGMSIDESRGDDGEVAYAVRFVEHRLEDLVGKLNRFDRADEKPFEAVNAISEFNQRAYELFMQPLIRATSNVFTAKLARQFHPLRFQRWLVSDLNPWVRWLGPAAGLVRERREPAAKDNALTAIEQAASSSISASLEFTRAMRDAASEAAFFQTYGNVFSLQAGERAARDVPALAAEARDLPFVQEALATMAEGGYPEAVARVGALLARKGQPMLLSWLQARRAIAADYADLLPRVPPDQWRRIRGEQEIIVRHEPDRALASLPSLLAVPADRARLVTLLRKLAADERIRRAKPTDEERGVVEQIGAVLDVAPTRRRARTRPVKAKARNRASRRTP